MKSQCLALLLSLTTLTAWAGNEGPQAAPTLPSQVLAEMVIGSGFGPPDMPFSTTIDIMKDGRVQEIQTFRMNRTVITELATLAPDTLAKLNKTVQSTKKGNIVDPDPKVPSCMDAPTTMYFAILNSGERIELGASEGCKEMRKDNATYGDKQIQKILQGFMSLIYLN